MGRGRDSNPRCSISPRSGLANLLVGHYAKKYETSMPCWWEYSDSETSYRVGAFDPCASCTSLTICCSALSLPTLVALNLNEPVLLNVAPKISSPGFFSTGKLSPVSIDSSTADAPSSIT